MTFATWYRVAGSGFVIRIANDGEIMDAMQLRTRNVHAKEIRLRTTTGVQRLEGDMFHVGARGLASIAGAIYGGLKNATGKLISSKMASLFAGDPSYADMTAATCRAAQGCDADSEEGYFLSRAEKQLSERPWIPIEVQFRDVETGLPLGLTKAA